MTEQQLRDVIIFTLGTLTELELQGLVEKTSDSVGRLTGAGMDEFIRLKKSGFSPSPEEIKAGVEIFRNYDQEPSKP